MTTGSSCTTATRASRWCATAALRAVIAGTEQLEFATSRLSDVDTMHAMTIHKSQGSQADEVTVLLPQEDSRLLTRELFYTAVTRAKTRVRVIGSGAGAAGRDRTTGGPGVRAGASSSRAHLILIRKGVGISARPC